MYSLSQQRKVLQFPLRPDRIYYFKTLTLSIPVGLFCLIWVEGRGLLPPPPLVSQDIMHIQLC